MKKLGVIIGALVMGIGVSFNGSILHATTTDNYIWKDVVIGGGGFTTGMVYHPNQKGLMYMRTDVGGVLRWDAQSKSWTQLMDGVEKSANNDKGALSIAIDPTDANKVYVMAGMYTQSWAAMGSFYASNDQGKTWTKTPLPFKVGGNENGRNSGERLQVDPNSPNILFMGSTKDGLWKTEDEGKTWEKVTSLKASNINFVCIDPSSGSNQQASQRIIVGTNTQTNALYMSEDGGKTWAPILGQPSDFCPIRVELKGDSLYLAYSHFNNEDEMPGPGGASKGAVYIYNLSSHKWSDITPQQLLANNYHGIGAIAVDPKDSKHIVVTSLDRWWPHDEIYATKDGGKTWANIYEESQRDVTNAPYINDHIVGWISDFKIDPFNPDSAIFSTGHGSYITYDLSSERPTWVFESKGFEETAAIELKSPPEGAQLISALGDVSTFIHFDLDKSPIEGYVKNGTNRGVDFAELVPSKIVRTQGIKNATAYASYSLDGGLTWKEFATDPQGAGSEGTIAISADGKSIVLTPRDNTWNPWKSFVSKDDGDSWTECKGLPIGVKVISDRVNPNVFYSYHQETGKVYRSTDGGSSFEVVTSALPELPSWLWDEGGMKAVYGKEGHLWATASSEGLFYSQDGGENFTKLSNVEEAYKIGFGKAAKEGGYPAIYLFGKVDNVCGFFRSDDEGQSWVRINDDLHQYGGASDITGDPKIYGRVYVGTRGVVYGDLQEQQEPEKKPMTVVITQPTNNSVIDCSTAGTAITLTAKVENSEAYTVEFFVDGKSVGTDSTVDFIPTDKVASADETRDYKVVAVAKDKDGQMAKSEEITITVKLPVEQKPNESDQPETSTQTVAVTQNKTNPVGNSLGVNIEIVNTGEPIDLRELELCYYFTSEGAINQNYYCDHAALQCNTSPWYIALNSQVDMEIKSLGDDQYSLVVKFNEITPMNEGDKLVLQSRIAKADWSDYNQTNDFSYNNGIAVYYKNALISGMQP